MLDAYIYDGLRSAVGRYGGALAGVRPDELAAQVLRAVLARSPFAPEAIEDVYLGNTIQAAEASRNLARFVGLIAGLPPSVGGETTNRLCGSGLAAIVNAARAVTCGDAELVIAGGVESMTRAPFILPKAESAYSRDIQLADSTLGVTFPHADFLRLYGNDPMSETAENIGAEMGISREDSDAFALASQQKYARAKAAGFFDGEIHPVTVPQRSRKAEPVTVSEDEHPRPNSDAAQLAKLQPLRAGGIVTAANAAGINDGAAILMMGSRAAGVAAGAKPMGRVVAAAIAGVEPRVMGLGPVPAINKALQRAGLRLDQMDVIEINEAFATQVLGCLRSLGIAADDARVNPNGGAIAIGHPLGCSGARLTLTALRQLEAVNGRYALVSLCIGIGQGIAVILER